MLSFIAHYALHIAAGLMALGSVVVVVLGLRNIARAERKANDLLDERLRINERLRRRHF